MSSNTAIQVQDALDRAAAANEGQDLQVILKVAAEELGIEVNETWAVEALTSRGWKVADVPDRAVTKSAR